MRAIYEVVFKLYKKQVTYMRSSVEKASEAETERGKREEAAWSVLYMSLL